jgi:hypothetical protein
LFRSLDALVALTPGRASKRAEAECQTRLLSCLRRAGARAAARLLTALKHRYPRSDAQARRGSWLWGLERAQPARAIYVTMHPGAIYFSYGLLPQPSPRRKTRHAMQERFYARWLELGQRAYRSPAPGRLSPADRLVLLVGELEADVNNGGFEQYLSNQGRRRARQALAALERVGARRTAALLAAALDAEATPREWDALDRRFYRVPEDLAVLVMRYCAPSARAKRSV